LLPSALNRKIARSFIVTRDLGGPGLCSIAATSSPPPPESLLGWPYTLNSFRLPQGDFTIDLTGVQVSYAFNRFLNITTFVQADTAQTQAVSANFRIRYTFRPDSDLYVSYNVASRLQSLAAGNPMQVRQEKIAVKVTYSWSR
jgi:hypothetical protein